MLQFIYWGDEVAAVLAKKHPQASLFWKIAHLVGLVSLITITLAVLLLIISTTQTNVIGSLEASFSNNAGMAPGVIQIITNAILMVSLTSAGSLAITILTISSFTLAVYCLSLGIVALMLGEPLWAAGCLMGCITILPLWPISAVYQYLKGKEILAGKGKKR